MKPQSYDDVSRIFDAFCKKVLRNEARDYLDEMKQRNSRGIPFSALPIEGIEQFASYDRYFIEDRTFSILGCTVYVDDADFAEQSPLCQRTSGILFSCFI